MKLLFVDVGNYCRSPVAAAVFLAEMARRGLAQIVAADSAGLEDHHLGQPAHPMTVQSALRRGIDLSRHRCRRIADADFAGFDRILAVDRQSLTSLTALCPPAERHRLGLLLAYAPELSLDDILDPNRQPAEAFERVLDLSERAAAGLAAALNLRP